MNYSELRARLRRRYVHVEAPTAEIRSEFLAESLLAWRIVLNDRGGARGFVANEFAPQAIDATPDV